MKEQQTHILVRGLRSSSRGGKCLLAPPKLWLMKMDESEQIAKKILEKEGHRLEKSPHPLSPDFECYSHCAEHFEIKSIGSNNDNIGFRIGQLQDLISKEATVLVIDRRTKHEVLRFRIDEVY